VRPLRAGTEQWGAVTLTHPDRELWPGITKRDLAAYWRSVASHALPGLVRRPLAIVRCPDGIAGERFFQKHGHGHMPLQIRAAEAGEAPYLAIDDIDGLYACAQIAAIELHAWGAAETDPLRPDQIVMDLDPGEGVPFDAVAQAAHETRARLESLGLESFPRTTGGKGLHVVAPLAPRAGWDEVRAFCHALAETMSQEEPERFLATVRKAHRRGRILIDWLRNDLGATGIASFCPRARPGATVATPLSWREVTQRLDPAQFTMRTLPQRLARLRNDPWDGFEAARRPLPDTPPGQSTHLHLAPRPKRP
jgi:bifunctional non-homologous end joining protein LigD